MDVMEWRRGNRKSEWGLGEARQPSLHPSSNLNTLYGFERTVEILRGL